MKKTLSLIYQFVPVRFVTMIVAACLFQTACSVTSEDTTTSVSTTTTTLAFGEGVYVSATGDDANSGMVPASPLQSLDKALTLAAVSNASYLLVSGSYDLVTNTASSNAGWLMLHKSNITVSGGWNTAFTFQDGVSVLNGHMVCMVAVDIRFSSGLTITNFVITGASNSSYIGGGISLWLSSSNMIECIVSNNAASYGGGIGLIESSNNSIKGEISGNSARQQGGGIGIMSGSCNTLSAAVSGNTSEQLGGGISIISANNIIAGTVSDNTSLMYGGGIAILGISNTITSTVSGNEAGQYGGGIAVMGGYYNTVSAAINDNTAGQYGGGVVIAGDNNTVTASSVIQYNRCDTGNTGTYYGGGIAVLGGSGNAIIYGAIVSPNYQGPGAFVCNDLYGIVYPTAP